MPKDFWTPLQAIILEICQTLDKGWQVQKRAIDTEESYFNIYLIVSSSNIQMLKSMDMFSRKISMLY